jgi:glutamate dehydrogenase
MHWETSCGALLDRAVRRLRLGKLSFPYEQGFPAEYRSLIPPRLAVRDALRLEAVARSGQVAADLRPPVAGLDEAHYRVQVYSARERGLDEIMPFLQNLNLRVVDQIQFKVEPGGQRFFIRSFSVKPAANGVENLLPLRKPLLLLLDALLSGQAEDDALNGLVLLTGLHWKEIDVFRAYRNYYFQLGSRFGRFRFHQALLGNPRIAQLLYCYFAGRFEPGVRFRDSLQREEEALPAIRLELIAALDAVTGVNEDRILRDLFNLIDATLRTNFYRRRDQTGHFIALKINSLGVINMPSPAPLVEIYVHSPAMEGIHLRGAKVARGGIRWSDRPDDFRGEILDLMHTQMIKNALIVPQGAKGGFILKTACKDAGECSRLARGAYVTLMRGLLDLTDNVEGSQVVRPPQVVTYDDADPYLVVAADKGTARLSDCANDIAEEYGYWLGDAFATGGSHGYDHKQLGITARGAWVCVKRHFHELGQDIDTQSFAAVGIGSMDGDVFGNGMLQSNSIRLLGAFSAGHIFLDPNPDPVVSFAERKRLFELPGSTWQDYNPAFISPGGGVFRRTAKDIRLSAEVRGWLGVRHPLIDGEELVRLLLTAPVDLLWLGGIGTYVKASSESGEDVGDRANDSVRVDALQLRAKVVGEGANLGFTQRGRIEYALNGGRINTDAVDNSGGVDLSDHEVNLKILMALPRRRGIIAAGGERNRFLAKLTDDVCRSVLANNYRQSLCLSLERERCLKDIEPFLELADQLENAGLLDRTVESFPVRKEIKARAAHGLTRPELAVLMACAKLALKQTLLEAPGFLGGEWTNDILAAYFPEAVRSRYAPYLVDHTLGREITATMICNTVIDQAGAGFLVWTGELDAGLLIEAVGAYLAFDQILEGGRWREGVYALDGKVAASRQYELLLQLEDALAFLTRWALERGQRFLPEPTLIGDWRADWRQYLKHLEDSCELATLGSFSPDAYRLVFLDRLRDFPGLVDLSRHSREALRPVAKLADAIMELLGLRPIVALLTEMKARDRWESRLRTILDDRLRSGVARLTRMMLRTAIREPAVFFRQYGMQQRLAKFQHLRKELHEAPPVALTPFAALGGELDALIDACDAASGHG